MSQNRQLAAIMFTDIVGYTALMGKDEQKAFELLEKNRQIQKPIIEQYNGKWIKELGDGVMASFTTVSDAVNAAIMIQQKCNTAKEFQLRIGIHLGEVVFEDNDVFGDGVNIASRIQAIANPGSIFVSESVHNSISNKKEFETKFFATQKLKNVKEPIKIYQLIAEGVVAAHQQIAQKIKRKRKVALISVSILMILIAAYIFKSNFTEQKNEQLSEERLEKSIAVLPFVNMSNNPEQEYFSDGITEDIITHVSKIGDLKVISRTAIMNYKGSKKTVREIAKELDVATILEGSVRRAGNQVRVVAQLINARNNEHLWAETYDKDFTQILAIQSNIAEQIASALQAKFESSSKEKMGELSPEKMRAYDYYLRGKFYLNENTREGTDTSITIFQQSIIADPNFALGYTALALAYFEKYFSYDPQKKWKEQSYVALEKAITLDPTLPEAYYVRARLLWMPDNHFPHEQAVAELRHALSLRPNFKEARNHLSAIYSHIGLHDKAYTEVYKALALDPLDMETIAQTGHQLYYQQKYTEMLAVFEKLPKNFGGSFNAGRTAEAILRLNRINEASLHVEELLKKFPDNTNSNHVAAMFYAFQGKKEMAEQKIKIAIESAKDLGHFHHTTYNVGVAYALMNKIPEAVFWLRKTAEDGMPCYTLFENDPYLKNLRKDNEFLSLLQTLKKQWEYYQSNL